MQRAVLGCYVRGMSPTTPKPWTLTLAGASAVPFAAYLAFIATDAFRCGFGHAVLIAILAGILMLTASGAAVVLAASVLEFWRGGFDTRRLRLAFTVLAFIAAVAGMAYGIHDLHNPKYCNIEL